MSKVLFTTAILTCFFNIAEQAQAHTDSENSVKLKISPKFSRYKLSTLLSPEAANAVREFNSTQQVEQGMEDVNKKPVGILKTPKKETFEKKRKLIQSMQNKNRELFEDNKKFAYGNKKIAEKDYLEVLKNLILSKEPNLETAMNQLQAKRLERLMN